MEISEFRIKVHVISFPKNVDIRGIRVGNIVEFKWIPEYLTKSDNFTIMGIPTLILDGKSKRWFIR